MIPKLILFFFFFLLSFLPTTLVFIWVLTLGVGKDITSPQGGLSFTFQKSDAGWSFFNWHPVLMVFAFNFCFSCAAVSYRALPFSHNINKTVHGTFQFLALCASTTAIAIVVTFKFKNGYGQFYSVHSWIGSVAYTLFVIQFLGGFCSFVFPRLPELPRAKAVVIHIFCGFVILACCTAAILTGIGERIPIAAPSSSTYSLQQIFANCIALSVLTVAAALIAYLLFASKHKNHHDQEHSAINVDHTKYSSPY